MPESGEDCFQNWCVAKAPKAWNMEYFWCEQQYLLLARNACVTLAKLVWHRPHRPCGILQACMPIRGIFNISYGTLLPATLPDRRSQLPRGRTPSPYQSGPMCPGLCRQGEHGAARPRRGFLSPFPRLTDVVLMAGYVSVTVDQTSDSMSEMKDIYQKAYEPHPHLLFRHPRTHLGWGGGSAHLPPFSEQLRNICEWKFWVILNPYIPDLSTLGNILTFTGQVTLNNVAF